MDSEGRPRTRSLQWRLSLIFSVVLLNVLLSSLVLSYGVILVSIVEQGVPIWIPLACPTAATAVYLLTQCWCREAADSWGEGFGHRVLAAMGLGTMFVSLIFCIFIPFEIHPVAFAVIGLGASLVFAQVDAVLFETYDTRLSLIRSFGLFGQAIGQFTLPHVVYLLIQTYGLSMAYLLLSGFILQAFPLILFVKITESVRTTHKKSRYQDFAKSYSIFGNEASTSYYSNDLMLNELNVKYWKSPSDDNILRSVETTFGDKADDGFSTITPPPSPEERRKNIFGIDLLPDIPEESEKSYSDSDSGLDSKENQRKKHYSSAIKRLSVMSDSLDECIDRDDRKKSLGDEKDNRNYTQINVSYDNLTSIPTHASMLEDKSLKFSKFKRRMRIPSYRIYRMKRRIIYFFDSIYDTFIKPLTRSLSCWRFYPALLLSLGKLLTVVINSALIQLFASNYFSHISRLETNFLISLHAFTWLCFLLTSPWLSKMSKGSYKYVVSCGFIVSSIGAIVISESGSYDALAIGCVVAGLGHGAITSSWEYTVQDFIGARKWSKIQSTLETASGAVFILAIAGLAQLFKIEEGLKWCLRALAATQALIGAMWTLISLITLAKVRFKTYRRTESLVS